MGEGPWVWVWFVADFGEEAMPDVRTPAETNFQTFDTSIVGDKVDLDIYCHVAWRRQLGMSVHPTLLYNAFHISQNSQTLSGLESIITSYPSCCQVLLHPIM